MVAGTVLNQVIILFLIMAVGFYTRKSGIINEVVSKKLSELLLKVTSPLLVISSFQVTFSQEILMNVVTVFVFAILAHLTSIAIGLLLFRRFDDGRKKILKFGAVYSNCGYMGFPLLNSLFGKVGVLFGSVYVAAFNIFLWTHGVMLFTNRKKLDRETIKKALLNPGITSVAVGLILFLFSIKLPQPLAESIDSIGSMTVPISMLIVGANLASCDFRKLLKGLDVYYITVIRLILLPVLAYFTLKLLGFSDMMLTICVLLVGMPVAAATAIFAEMHDADAIFASRAVALSTLASIGTIPLIMLLQ